MSQTVRHSPVRVLLLGFGAIGRHVSTLLAPERDAGLLRLRAAERNVASHGHRTIPGVELVTTGEDTDCPTWPEALAVADLVVECAGVAAAGEYGPGVITAGTDLILTSVGALADPDLARTLLAGPGRLWVTNGAIGGFDVLSAAADADGLDSVRIRTTKLPTSLIRPWMTESEEAALRALRPGDAPVTVFSGGPAKAIERFPANVNVAVGLGWATRGRGSGEAELLRRSLERVRVELMADPGAARSRHEILATGTAGRFELAFESAPSPENPKTSGLTALSVARTVREALAAFSSRP
ncbi:aspartate dehydrogenase domain-containing protein [Citricoccus sp. K5]|uniref:aspartate dehydrogenase domain-containing protein n=1 Tax=Citricoccus sp. K5 TaxID=2653135 RepID=UPI0012F23339|nr:aspartate dehydrogenase domain-containing protein [Citricoccus sp. K5]VXC01403.1 Aspartate dehydrogenase [Citricoccus sp. K5]